MAEVFDATGCVLGRLASKAAETILEDEETELVIVNCEKAIVTGDKDTVLQRYREKYQRGTARKGPHFPRVPDRLVKRTVRGMIPYDKPRGRNAYKRLRCYIGEPEGVPAENAQTPDGAQPKSVTSSIEVADISRHLGAKVR